MKFSHIVEYAFVMDIFVYLLIDAVYDCLVIFEQRLMQIFCVASSIDMLYSLIHSQAVKTCMLDEEQISVFIADIV